MDSQADVTQTRRTPVASTGYVFKLKADFPAFHHSTVRRKSYFSADHPVCQILFCGFRSRTRTDFVAIPQDSYAITNLNYFMQFVGDEDQCVPISNHLPHNDE